MLHESGSRVDCEAIVWDSRGLSVAKPMDSVCPDNDSERIIIAKSESEKVVD